MPPLTAKRVAQGNVRPQRGAVLLALAGFLIFVFYLVTAPENRSGSDDAFKFAYEVEEARGSDRINPRGVLLVPAMQLALGVVRVVDPAASALGVVPVVNAMLAAGVVLLQFLLLRRRLGLGRNAALVGAGLLAFAFSFWRFSAEIEVYSLSLFLAMAALYLGLSRTAGWRVAAAAGFLAALAVVAHLVNLAVAFLAIPVAMAAARRSRALVVYLAVLVPLVLAASFTAYLEGRTDESYLGFYTSEAGIGLDGGLVARGVVGSAQSIASAEFLFGYSGFADAVGEALPDRDIKDEVFYGERLGGLPVAAATITLSLVVVAFLGCLVLSFPDAVRRWRSPAVAALLVWLGVVAVFQLMSRVGSDGPEVWLFAHPPLTVLMAVGLARRGPLRGVPALRVGAVLVALLLVHNGIALAMLQSPERDRSAARAAWLVDNAAAGDLVLTADGTLFWRYLRYHTDAETEYLPFVAESELPGLLDRAHAAGRRVYATGDVFDLPPHLLSRLPDDVPRLIEFGEGAAPRFTRAVDDPFGGVFVMTS